MAITVINATNDPEAVNCVIPRSSPWGTPDTVTIMDPFLQIYTVTTPSHGGIHVAATLDHEIPEDIRALGGFRIGAADGGAWYEEDCEWAKVAIQFPDRFPARDLAYALRYFVPHDGGSYELPMARLQRWLREGK